MLKSLKAVKAPTMLLVGILVGILLTGFLAFVEQKIDGSVRSLVFLDSVTTPVLVDGEPVSVDAYQIKGANYIKLRDFTRAVNVGVWWDSVNNIIRIETDKEYDPDYQGPQQ